ncbi:hypothetical protein [Glycomyces paridis]|uniref:DUF3558 domain-containing protein n=1 Tax=Glycomyces paridis TaxID=2126555 RepID=A0A4S8PKY9_9ACTN|nr:hypothetical protein [Glycomyces paridis]THV30242.1 hypothetical protein E9998_07705 [Glycomyces paridis]
MALLLGCQPNEEPDDPEGTASEWGTETPTDDELYSLDVTKDEVCPEADKVESLPRADSYTVDRMPFGTEADQSDGYTGISCRYGVRVNTPEYERVEDAYVYVLVNLTIQEEPFEVPEPMEIDYEPLSYFDDWNVVYWDLQEGEYASVCASEQNPIFDVGDRYDCGATGPFQYAQTVLDADSRNLRLHLRAEFCTPEATVSDADREVLAAVMSEVAALMTEAVPLVER